MLYLFFALTGLIIGFTITRRPRGLLLEQMHLLWLLIPGLLLVSAPSVLAVYKPKLLWEQDNRLLLILISASHAVLLLIVFVNIIYRLIDLIRAGHSIRISRSADRKLRPLKPDRLKLSDYAIEAKTILVVFLILASLAGLAYGIGAHGLVLINNQGMMPISEQYLSEIDDPVLVEGIRNGALYFKRIITPDTKFAQFGQIVKAPRLAFLLPDAYTYISKPELIIAFFLSLTILLSMVLDKIKRQEK